MAQQPQRTRPFVADPSEWEVVGDEWEAIDEAPPAARKTWADDLGLNEGTDSRLVGFLRGAGAGAVDLAQGAVATIANQVQGKREAEQHGVDAAKRVLAGDRSALREPVPPSQPAVDTPPSFSGAVGSMLPVVGEMAIGGVPAVRAGVKAIPSAVRAGETFQDVMSAAKAVPIETKVVGDAALRIQELADRGSSMPLSVSKLLRRMTDPNKAAMAYEESRDFASNISRLSVNEFNRLSPAMAREVANLRVALNEANAQAAKFAGKGAEYKAAMREYSQAMRLKGAIDAAVTGAKRAVPVATAGGLAYWLTGKVRAAISGQE